MSPLNILSGFGTNFPDQDRHAALGFVNEAFAEAIMAGVDAESFAAAAIFTGMQELVASLGEQAVTDFVTKLVERVQAGEFSIEPKH